MKHEKSKNDAMRHELDHIDAKILNLLRENARMPLKEIAEHYRISGQIKSGAFGISDQSVHQPRG